MKAVCNKLSHRALHRIWRETLKEERLNTECVRRTAVLQATTVSYVY